MTPLFAESPLVLVFFFLRSDLCSGWSFNVRHVELLSNQDTICS